MMKIATWNVNSLKVRLPHVLGWLAEQRPDVLCLQETKLEDQVFPHEALAAAGYQAVFSGQKTYNGVAILARNHVPQDARRGIKGYEDPQQRVMAATIGGLRIVCVYVPNGQEVGCDKYAYKLEWLNALQAWLQDELQVHPQLLLLGDYNIAPDDRDVHDPKAWQGRILCSEAERTAFQGLLGLGLVDAYRLFEQPEKSFSWWDYRMQGFRRNLGLRIDLILLTQTLAKCCTASAIDRAPRGWERPSDHAPVWVQLDLPDLSG